MGPRTPRTFRNPLSMMPEVKPSSGIMAYTATTIFAHEIPIAGVAGDQQAALFGQMCVQPGAVKHLWHRVLPTHEHRRQAYNLQNRLLSTIAWQIGDKVTYALEGSIFVGGPWCNGFATGCTAYTVGRSGGFGSFCARHRRRLFRACPHGPWRPLLGPICQEAPFPASQEAPPLPI